MALVLGMVSTIEAQVPNQLHYQGYLVNAVGEPVDCPDAVQCTEQYDLRFRLYDLDSGGVVLWEEIHTEVALFGGSFHVRLGQAVPITGAMLEDSTWLGVTVNDNVEMDPRQQVLSAAYALRAETAEESVIATNAIQLGGIPAAEYVTGAHFSGDYDDLSNKPVPFSGDYTDLSNTPLLFSGDYDDLSNKPVLFSGDYTDLSNTPILFSGSYTDLSDRPAGLDDGDNDTLAGLSCTTDQVARWNGSAWECSEAGSNTVSVPTSEPGPCTAESAGSMYYDALTNELRICDGSEYQSLTVCSAACPAASEVGCQLPRQNGCGANCGGNGTGLNLAQCADPAAVLCGGAINDLCSNDCGVTGTSYDAAQCAPASVVCGDPVYDSCGNPCEGAGTQCPEGSYCMAGACGNNPWYDANITWNASSKVFGRYTWDQAGVSNNGRPNGETFCTSRGGTLARPNSQAEWDGIFNNIPQDANGWWIDGHNNFSCGSATPASPIPYQYGLIYVPAGTNEVYTGCNCNTSEQGLVAYYNTGSGPFDGCQNNFPPGNLGLMDENLTYDHSNIYGFICEH
jgi:hypothetical protein